MSTKERREMKREAKRDGQRCAREWIRSATIGQRVALAGCDLQYGETLSDLNRDGFDYPRSDDVDFSWGFFKQVKGHVYHALYR